MYKFKKKKIFIIMSNPDADSFSGAMADVYEQAAKKGKHTVRRINLGDLKFDPILHRGYKEIQELEPDLIKLQEDIKWAQHVVFIYPNWWCTMPALLKGMFDRIWLPGFAFNFDKKTGSIIRRMKGKSSRVIVVAGTHSPLFTRIKFGDYTNEISRGILGFSGMDVSVSTFGPCDKCSDAQRKRWMEEVELLGQRSE